MKRLILAIPLFVMLFTGCATVHFSQPASVSIRDIEPGQLLERFKANLPETVSSLNSVVFEYAGISFLGLGFVEIDRSKGTFRVICLNPMGVKLFDLSGDKDVTTTNFAIEPIAKYGEIGAAVAADIRRIYFDLLPPPDTEPRKGAYRFIYGSATPKGYQEHIFAGIEGDLTEKRFYSDQFISWQVTYHDYKNIGGKRYPQGIVLTNYSDAYQLVIREKEQELEKDKE
jgi:hypothetical protein